MGAPPVKHLERHPEPVEGCFGCHALGLQFVIPFYMSARGDSNEARETEAGIKAKVQQHPDRYVQGKRWV